MKRTLAIFLCASFVFSTAFADNGLWTEGKDRVQQRVNVDLKSLSPEAYIRVAERVDEAIVNISTTTIVKTQRSPRSRPFMRPPRDRNDGDRGQPGSPFDDFFGDDFFDRFFGMPMVPPPERRQQSLGSGFIINTDGFIVTNNHVVERADEIKVTTADGSDYTAKVVGRDPKTDVALIRIETKKKLTPVVLGDSDSLKVGEVVVAIGNPFGLSHSVTQGIVSAKERSIGFGNYDDFIQTDASINPGNSGGPLLNLHGEVVGINAAIHAGGQGIGFAIPINLAKKILVRLKTQGKVVRGWLGVLIQPVTEDSARALKLPKKAGALVAEVTPGSPAEKAGLKPGDVIVKFNGAPIKESSELPTLVADQAVGKKITLEVIREELAKTVEVELGELKDTDGTEPADTGEGQESGHLGITVQGLTSEIISSLGIDPETKGVVVTEVDEAGPSATKGIRQGDVIVEVNRKKVESLKDYREVTSALKKGDTVLLLIKRGKGTLFIAFTL